MKFYCFEFWLRYRLHCQQINTYCEERKQKEDDEKLPLQQQNRQKNQKWFEANESNVTKGLNQTMSFGSYALTKHFIEHEKQHIFSK